MSMDSLINRIRSIAFFKVFTWMVRILLAIGFLPSGIKKILGERFTSLGLETPVGFFFEALYRAGFYWNFLGIMQLLAALLLLVPRTSFFGALVYFPIILNIFIIVTAMGFKGTPIVAGLMLLANLYLLFWDYERLKLLQSSIFNSTDP